VSVTTGPKPEPNSNPVHPELQQASMDAAICIGCGACVAACPNGSAMLFTGAKATHLNLLPQGEPEALHRTRSMVRQMDAEGFGGCTNHGECEYACPQEISIKVIGELNSSWRKSEVEKLRRRRGWMKPQ
jgi:succinate dehydrogenase / fumarate reductase iron-sulfur subunit